MRTFFREPIYEMLPADEMNNVSVICKASKGLPFKLVAPAPVLLDPTRRLENPKKFFAFPRTDLEMYHMSFIRKNMKSKMENVSNKFNYMNIQQFLLKFETWTPSDGIVHPHPHIGKQFNKIGIVPNYFNIDWKVMCSVCYRSLVPLQLCSRCKQVNYCGIECQKKHWPTHKLVCK
jgi:hypothetical protein